MCFRGKVKLIICFKAKKIPRRGEFGISFSLIHTEPDNHIKQKTPCRLGQGVGFED